MRKLRPREVQPFVQGHIANRRQRQGSKPQWADSGVHTLIDCEYVCFFKSIHLIFLNLSKAVSVKSGDKLITLFLIPILNKTFSSSHHPNYLEHPILGKAVQH